MMKIRARDILGYMSLGFFVLTLAISLVIAFTPLYDWTSQALGLADSLALTQKQLMENYCSLLAYLNFPWIEELVLPDFPSSSSGLFHFYEVKRLFALNGLLLILSSLTSFFYLKSIKKRGRERVLLPFFKWGMILPFLFLFLLVINFDWLFRIFHEIMFNNDAWLFDPATDPIILALPQEFFMVCFTFVFIFIVASLALAYYFTRRKVVYQKKN